VRDKYVRSYDFNTSADIGLLSVRKFGSPYVPPRTLSFNPAERAAILTISSDNGMFELTALPQQTQGDVKGSSMDRKRDNGQSAIFVARNRFAVLNKPTQVRALAVGFSVFADVDHVRSSKFEISRMRLLRLSNALYRRAKYFTVRRPVSSSVRRPLSSSTISRRQ